MKLNQRLKQAGIVPPDEPPPAPTERAPRKPAPAPATRIQSPAPKSGDAQAPGDPLAAIKQRAQESLFTRLGGRLFRPDMNEEQLHHLVIEELGHVLKADRAPLSPAERQRLVDDISEDVLGYGPLEGFLADPAVSEIMVTGTRPIYVERAGRLTRRRGSPSTTTSAGSSSASSARSAGASTSPRPWSTPAWPTAPA